MYNSCSQYAIQIASRKWNSSSWTITAQYFRAHLWVRAGGFVIKRFTTGLKVHTSIIRRNRTPSLHRFEKLAFMDLIILCKFYVYISPLYANYFISMEIILFSFHKINVLWLSVLCVALFSLKMSSLHTTVDTRVPPLHFDIFQKSSSQRHIIWCNTYNDIILDKQITDD